MHIKLSCKLKSFFGHFLLFCSTLKMDEKRGCPSSSRQGEDSLKQQLTKLDFSQIFARCSDPQTEPKLHNNKVTPQRFRSVLLLRTSSVTAGPQTSTVTLIRCHRTPSGVIIRQSDPVFLVSQTQTQIVSPIIN